MTHAMVKARDGTRLYAEAHGEGIPLIFSCAFCTTRENWRGQVDPLTAAGARVILWDYRGHGRSGAPSDPDAYHIDRVVEDLGAVLDWAAPGETAVLAGLSFGGLVSLHFAHRHPARARGLVLVGSGPGFKKPAALEDWKALVERTAGFLETRGLAEFVAGKAGATCIGLDPELPAARAAAAAIVEQDPHAVAQFGRRVAGLAPPILDELPDIRCPALVIVGERDKPFLRAAEVMTAKLPRATRVTVPDAGHIVNIEAGEAFNAEVSRFLRGLTT